MFTMRMTEFEKKQYEKFGKENGCNTLAKLIRRSVKVVMENPDLLNPIQPEIVEQYAQMRELLADRKTAMESIIDAIEGLYENQEKITRKVDFLVKKTNPTKKELKEIETRDSAAKAIFD